MKYEEFVMMNLQGESHWWYRSRTELLKDALKKVGGNRADLKILDLASACGDNFPVCSKYGKTFGIDISPQAIEYCKQRNITSMVQGDAQKLPFKSNTYDVILALDVFEHLEDDMASLKEIVRVLKEDGTLIFNTPAFMALYSYHDIAFHHVRRYRRGELASKLASADLQIRKMTYWSFFIFPAVYIMRKFIHRIKDRDKNVQSDFHNKINPFVEKIIKSLVNIEVFLIKKNISFPFGVSIYGIAQKRRYNL